MVPVPAVALTGHRVGRPRRPPAGAGAPAGTMADMTSSAHACGERPEAFYLPEGESAFRPTEAAQGPWDPTAQHGGPPAALAASVIDGRTGRPGLRIARVTAEFLGPVPLGVLEVGVRVLRPGRRVQLAEAELSHAGRPVAFVRAWQHAVAEHPDPAVPAAVSPAAPPLPADDVRDSALLNGFGYGRAMRWRTTTGSMDVPGPAAVWARPSVPLVAGTALTGLQRALLLADSANGASLSLPLDRFLSMPTSLTVALLRHPAGAWVHLDAVTEFSGDGVGLAHARLSDDAGPLGTVTQPLLVAVRG